MVTSFKTKIVILIILVTSICTLAFTGVSFYEVQKAATSQMKNDGSTLISVVNRDIKNYKITDLDEFYNLFSEAKKGSNGNIAYISFVDSNNKLLVSDEGKAVKDDVTGSKNSVDTAASATISNGKETGVLTEKSGDVKGTMLKTSSGKKVYNVSTPFYEGTQVIGTINIGVSLESMNNVIRNNFIQSLFISLIILLVAVLIGIVISNTMSKPLSVIVEELDQFAHGDFTISFKGKGGYEVNRLTDSLNGSINILRLTIGDIKNVIIQLNGISQNLLAFGEITSSSAKDASELVGEVLEGISNQNENIAEIVKKLEDFGATLDDVNLNIESVSQSSARIRASADIGAEKLKVLVESIEDVRNSFAAANKDIETLNGDVNKIGDITDVINKVAEQTNLLALNAAIEAARAGESGRGFAVVAEEIRKLAEQVLVYSKSINNIINTVSNGSEEASKTSNEISEKMNKQFKVIEDTVTSFKEILDEIHNVIPQVKNVCDLIRNTVEEKEEIILKVDSISDISGKVASFTKEISDTVGTQVKNVEGLSAAAQDVNYTIERLTKDISKFRIE